MMNDDSLTRACHHLVSLQQDDGAWQGEMVWCTMILSQVVIVRTLAGRPIDAEAARRMIRHYAVTRTAEGVWGLHPESGGYVFTTTLAYVALRLLGVPPDDPLVATARRWLHSPDNGVLAIPTWGKLWLAMAGLIGWDGVNPFSPETFLLPACLSFHPDRFYCHTRCIYLAIAYLFGRRFIGKLGPITQELRQELYGLLPHEFTDPASHRHRIAPSDLYVRPSPLLRLIYDAMTVYERRPFARLRQRALDHCLRRIVAEQQTTRYQGLSPVNALLNCLALLADNPQHPDLERSLAGVEAWKWDDEAEGTRYVGARSHTWDTAFAIRAILAGLEVPRNALPALHRAYRFLDGAQLTEEIPDREMQKRDPALGGWCFSDGAHRWPVSDCTAEALTAILAMHKKLDLPPAKRISDQRLHQAAVFILSRQNRDGGFGTYEKRRGPAWLDGINPSEMYGACMTERSYLECTGSCLAALAHYRTAYPYEFGARLDRAISSAVGFLRRNQRPDGSWPGFWGVNFTYAIFHAVKGMCAAAIPPSDTALQRAADWLIRHQRPDGGWGEHYTGCLRDSYVEHAQSLPVQTSWALLALQEVLDRDADAIARGIAWLKSVQQPDGGWAQPAVTGVFFGTAMLDYRLYKAYFPAWALARHAATPAIV